MCPGVTRSAPVAPGATAVRTVWARSRAEMPVVMPVAGVDADGEGGAARRSVVLGHHRQPQGRHLLLGQGQADEAPPEAGHEVDGLGGDQVGGHGQIALVLPVFIVDHDDHAAGADLGHGFIDGQVGGRFS